MELNPNKLKNREFANAESPRFDLEKTGPLLDIGAVFSESKMGLSAKAKTESSTCLGLATSAAMLPIKMVATSDKWIPLYHSEGSSGADLLAAIDAEVEILPGKVSLIPTGIRIEVPEGFEVQVRSRSGLALKSQVSVLNAPGTIDSDYRGEVGVILMNHGVSAFTVAPGMRIAQIVVCPIVRAQFIPVLSLTDTDRGQGGFGHTGF